jgi:hypothetical protein
VVVRAATATRTVASICGVTAPNWSSASSAVPMTGGSRTIWIFACGATDARPASTGSCSSGRRAARTRGGSNIMQMMTRTVTVRPRHRTFASAYAATTRAAVDGAVRAVMMRPR